MVKTVCLRLSIKEHLHLLQYEESFKIDGCMADHSFSLLKICQHLRPASARVRQHRQRKQLGACQLCVSQIFGGFLRHVMPWIAIAAVFQQRPHLQAVAEKAAVQRSERPAAAPKSWKRYIFGVNQLKKVTSKKSKIDFKKDALKKKCLSSFKEKTYVHIEKSRS